jgi:hypothetical protein
MLDRAIGLAGLALTIIGVVMVTLFPIIDRKLAWAGFIFGLILLGTSVGIALMPEGQAQSPPAVYQGPGSAYSSGQQGGITAGTVNIAPPRAAFSPQVGNDLLAHMPSRKSVVLNTVGGDADQKVGDDVQQFLEGNGYSVQRRSIGMMAPPPDHPFSFSDNPNTYVITVAPSAH